MPIFLLICSSLLLLLGGLTYWQIYRVSAGEFIKEWGESLSGHNGSLQITYGTTGLYVLFVLTAMKHLPATQYLGVLTILDSLLFSFASYRLYKHAPLHRYYSSGIGVYLSGFLQIVFCAAAIYYLIPNVF